MGAIPWPNLTIELVTLGFAILCVYEAWKLGVGRFTAFLTSILFGLAIEVYFTTQYSGYSYGPFLIDPIILGSNVPVWVGCGWGVIIFVAMAASDRMDIPWGVRPVVDALLAVTLDFALDPIAEALGFWHWSRPVPPEQMFYGVPFDNFCGWLLIVGSFSLFVRLGFRIWGPGVHIWRDTLIPIVALVPCILSVVVCQFGLDAAYQIAGEPVVFAAVLGAPLVPVLYYTRKLCTTSTIPWYLAAIPVCYHGMLLLFLFACGVYKQESTLIVLMPLAAFASVVGYGGVFSSLRVQHEP